MRDFLGQGVCRALLPLGLVGIAPQPEGHGRNAPATCARVMPIEDGRRAVLLGVVERQALLQVGVRKGQLAQQEPGGPQRVVGLL
jgi:hypothetical protein